MSVTFGGSSEIEWNGTENAARFELYADTAADLSDLTHFDSILILAGSRATDISTGDKYLINSSGVWIRQPSESAFDNVYTKAEIDSMFSPVTQSAQGSAGYLNAGGVWSSIFNQILGLNTTRNFASGDDANDVQEPGIFRATTAATAQGVLNLPGARQAGGRLICFNVGGSGRWIQIYIDSGARLYMRGMLTSAQTWSHWFEYGGTDTGA